MSDFLPYGRQYIDDDDIAAVTAVLRGDYLTTGPSVQQFEDGLRQVTGAPHVSVCSNGTAALHLAMLALGVGEGDIVVVPSMTFLASANAVRFVNAEVVFADVDGDTGLLTPQTLEAAIARAPRPPRAAVVVHLGGQTADLDGLATVAARHGMEIVEDACHALGTRHRYSDGEGRAGDARRSRCACFSFHPVKTIAVGEGGAVTTRDPAFGERVARLRNHGMVKEPSEFTLTRLGWDDDGAVNPWHYEMPEIGFNYRLSDINCALGVSQLRKLPAFVGRRTALAKRYDELLRPLSPIVRPVSSVPWSDPALHLYAVLIEFEKAGRRRGAVMTELRKRGIGTQVHYIPVHRQPYYVRRYGLVDLPGVDAYFGRELSLPLFYGMSDADPDRVVSALRDVLGLQG